MIFRVVNNQLFSLDFDVADEDKFVQEQSNPDNELHFIKALDDDLPENDHPEVEPFYALDENGAIILDYQRMLNQYKYELIASINNVRDTFIGSGFIWTRTETDEDGNEITNNYHFGLTQDYINSLLSVAVSALLGQTQDLFFITLDNITVDNLTKDEVSEIALTAFGRASGIIHKTRIYKDRILAAADFDSVNEIIVEMKNDPDFAN